MTTPSGRWSVNQPSPAAEQPQPASTVALGERYGFVGIPAVAAAMRYSGPASNPAYAQAPDTARLAARMDELSAV